MKKLLRKSFLNIVVLFIVVSFTNISSSIKAMSEVNPDEVATPTISIDGEIVKLYKEFENNEASLVNFFSKYKVELNNIKNKFNLKKDLDIKNWEEYYGAIKTLYNENMNHSTLREFVSFFDIFENKYKNNQIKHKVSVHDYSGLEYLLPVTSVYVENVLGSSINLDKLNKQNLEKQKELGISSRATSLPDMGKAIKYATDYAEKPNSSQYQVFSGGDCANFVSQILEAGGIQQIKRSSIYEGWWHSLDFFFFHSHSHSWTVADVFVRYMGVSSVTTSHETFSARINAGTIIAADFDSDSDWDHVGFVVQADNYKATYGGKTYYDYKVAQHTSNYLAWTSSSTNGWEDIRGRYAIVRQ